MNEAQNLSIAFQGCDVHIERMFDIHDNQQVTIHTPQPTQAPTPHDEDVQPSPLVEELLPIFLGVEAEAQAFLQAIDGAKPTFITQHVNDLLRQQKVLRAGCRRPLWTILNRYHLYTPSESNWNQQVNA